VGDVATATAGYADFSEETCGFFQNGYVSAGIRIRAGDGRKKTRRPSSNDDNARSAQ
jgi:hypothetical protein